MTFHPKPGKGKWQNRCTTPSHVHDLKWQWHIIQPLRIKSPVTMTVTVIHSLQLKQLHSPLESTYVPSPHGVCVRVVEGIVCGLSSHVATKPDLVATKPDLVADEELHPVQGRVACSNWNCQRFLRVRFSHRQCRMTQNLNDSEFEWLRIWMIQNLNDSESVLVSVPSHFTTAAGLSYMVKPCSSGKMARHADSSVRVMGLKIICDGVICII